MSSLWTPEQLADPDFESSVYSDRLNIDNPFRDDLITRDGKQRVKITRLEEHYAYGTLDDIEWSWYHSENDGRHSFLQNADYPDRRDVMVPKESNQHV